MTTLVRSTSPHRDSSPDFALVCDWLATNGIDELIPERPTFLVQDGQIIYRAFKFVDEQRGHDHGNIAFDWFHLLMEDRVVPLLAPVTDDVRAAFEHGETADRQWSAFLVEVINGSVVADKAAAYHERLGM